jgi:hypothetical protein
MFPLGFFELTHPQAEATSRVRPALITKTFACNSEQFCGPPLFAQTEPSNSKTYNIMHLRQPVRYGYGS